MRDDDYDEFSSMLDDVAALLPPSSPLTATGRAMFFRALAPLALPQVRAGLDAHVRDPQRGRFFPRPADVIAQVPDDRLGADEAWALAVKSRDERASVVWTDEIAEAWGIARSVLELGDEIGARVAFRDAYSRIIAAARTNGSSPQWFASLGHDPEGRAQALIEEGRVLKTGFVLLDPPKRGGDPLLELMSSSRMPAGVRENLMAIRDRLAKGVANRESCEDAPSLDFLEKQRTIALKASSAKQVADYMQERGL